MKKAIEQYAEDCAKDPVTWRKWHDQRVILALLYKLFKGDK